MIDNILASIVRTAVPAIVGVLVAWIAKTGLQITDATITSFITVAVTAGYYGLVRIMETRYSSQWGWFLGIVGAPKYVAPALVAVTDVPESTNSVA